MKDRETGRIEAFSDGVFAIAITLLILEIKVPAVEGSLTNEKLFALLRELWPSYTSFLLSFAVVLIMWINHHGFFKFLRAIDARFLYANGLLLLLVTFIPFPTAVLARYINTDAANTAAAFYCGTMVLLSIAYNALWFTAAYKRRLVKETVTDKQIQRIRNAYIGGLAVYIASFVISFFHAISGLSLCVSLWGFWIILDYSKER